MPEEKLKINKNRSIGLFITILVLIFLGGVFFLKSSPEKSITTKSDKNISLAPTIHQENQALDDNGLRKRLISNINLTVPGTKEIISLSGGEGKWSEGYVLIGKKVVGLPNGDMITTFDLNSGGNSRDVYLAVFKQGENAWQMTDAKMLGEPSSNAEVSDLSTDGTKIFVTYKTYGDDMTSQADVKKVINKKVFIYKNGNLEEVIATP